jgi:hypothetical protein
MAETANPARPAGLSGQVAAFRATFGRLTLYEQFEHAVIIVLTVLIIAVVAAATWHLALGSEPNYFLAPTRAGEIQAP